MPCWPAWVGAMVRPFGTGHREHASAGRPTLEPWAVSPSLDLAAPAARPNAP
jgi:hypothetical protein